MSLDELQTSEFTDRAMESFYGAVDDPYFRDRDQFLIYDALRTGLRLVPFGDHLKRYIHEKAQLEGDYQQIPLKEYQEIILTAFSENDVPPAFYPTTARLSALAKNWLTQQTVKRSVVFLLGFGLGMSEADVDDFLTKALREPVIDPKDPFELICGYCFRNGLGYLKYRALWERFEAMPVNEDAPADALFGEHTVLVRGSAAKIRSEAELIAWLRRMRRTDSTRRQSVAARDAFDRLYREAQARVADIFNASEGDEGRRRAHREDPPSDDGMRDDRSGSEIRRSDRRCRPEDITPSDIERVICSAVPMGTHGNLAPARDSSLSGQFAGKRFSRQHVSEVLAGRAPIDRFDLITLNFFIYSQLLEQYVNPRRRYSSFIESTNRLLRGCGMGDLYVANPYECFILMCLLSDDPLGTYADVWEMSYRQDE
ncbi:MAG: hypothetical protein IJJ45_11055 [Clostridia bacterium]|nr:hypothetical protein [Clostridia bacterium]